MSGWRLPQGEVFSYLSMGIPYLGRSDFILNVLVYIPVGLLFMLALRHNYRSSTAMILATAVGILLSFSMESLQVFLPNRTPGIIDLLTNTAGTFLGVALGSLTHEKTFSGRRLIAIREKYFLDGSWVNMGLTVIGVWALMLLSPLVITLDVGKLREGIAPAWHLLQDPSLFRWYSFWAAFLFFIGLNILVRQIVRPERAPVAIFLYFSLAVLLVKIFVVSRQFSLEQVIALFGATLFASIFSNARTNVASRISVIAICTGYIISQLAPGTEALTQSSEFNWIPFGDQIATLNGISSILENLWPFMAMAYLLHISIQEYQRNIVMIVGGFFVAILSFALEWMQQYIPGRTADISAVIVALIGWLIPLKNSFYNTHNPARKTISRPKILREHQSQGQQ